MKFSEIKTWNKIYNILNGRLIKYSCNSDMLTAIGVNFNVVVAESYL